MADEPDDEPLIEVEGESEGEYIECHNCTVILPHGVAWYADTRGFAAIRVNYKDGTIEGEDNDTGKWRKPEPREVVTLKTIQ